MWRLFSTEMGIYVKGAGLLLILVSGTGLGLCKCKELVKQEQSLEILLRMVILLKGEIRYGNASLYDAFTGAAGKLPGEYGVFLRAVADEIQTRRGESFGEIFRSCACKNLGTLKLGKEEKEKLFSLGDHLGYLDLDMQMKQLELFEADLEYSIEKMRKELPEKKKVYKSLGILLGILLAVVIW